MQRNHVERPQMLIAGTSDAFARVAATRIVEEINAAIGQRQGCSLFLAGGGTAAPVYREMARPQTSKRLDWSRVSFYFDDEYCVPADDPRSNYRMASDLLLGPLGIPPEHIHRIRGESSDPDEEAARYAAEIPPHIDIMLLGIGRDGHTASLFPGSSAIDEKQRAAVLVVRPRSASRHITITPPVLQRARLRIVLVSGVEKAGIVARALRGPYAPHRLPVQLTLPGLWIVDAVAVSELRLGIDHGVL